MLISDYQIERINLMGELEIFATRIKELRDSLKMTQKDFSEHIGIKQQTLSGYERGIMKPPLDIAKGIAEKCNVSIDWLCGLSDESGLQPEIANYKDIAIKILDLLKIDSFPYKFCLELLKEDVDNHSFPELGERQYVRAIRLPEEPELLKFFETYEDLQRLLKDKKIKQHVIDTWLEGALEELSEIPINIPEGINDELPFDVDESLQT